MSVSNSSRVYDVDSRGGQCTDCRNFSFETYINNPVQKEVEKLRVLDTLLVKIAVRDSIEEIQIMHGTEAVGGIVDQATILKHGLEIGCKFQATVRSISGSVVRIHVEPV